MTPITIGIAMAIFGLQMLTNKKVVTVTKQLVTSIEKSNKTGQEKTDFVMGELLAYFTDIVPILLEAVIKLVVLDMQNKDGTLQTKLNDMKTAK